MGNDIFTLKQDSYQGRLQQEQGRYVSDLVAGSKEMNSNQHQVSKKQPTF